MKLVLNYLGQIAKKSYKGTTEGAFDWGPVISSFVLSAYLTHLGLHKMPPVLTQGWERIGLSALVFTIVAWPVLFIIKFLFVSPYRLWRDDHIKLERLENAIKPKLEIMYSDNNVHFVDGGLRIKSDSGEPITLDGKLVRVTIYNKSKNKTIKDAHCVIYEIEGNTHAFSNQPLQPLESSINLNLVAQAKQVIQVLFIPNSLNYGICIGYDESNLSIGRWLPRKNYRILLQAQGIDIAPTRRWLNLKFDGEKANVELE